ncbi:hypothetical protein KJ682_09730 [bacterium]|nr:hypothetical protein [bacterium]
MRRSEPWKWPLCLACAVTLLVLGVFLTPRAWIFLLPQPGTEPPHAAPVAPGRWWRILPPPEIEVVTRSREDTQGRIAPLGTVPAEDPRWWTEGWQVVSDRSASRDWTAAARDSLDFALEILGLPADVRRLARPDSILARRLFFLRLEESFSIEELKPYLRSLTHGAALEDIYSRAADMYDDFLRQRIMATDPPE